MAESITCSQCKRVSYSQGDIEHKYCGYCNMLHNEKVSVSGTMPSLSRQQIEDKVKQVLFEQLGVFEGQIVPEASIIEDLGADSLDFVELSMAFEEEFGIKISYEEAEKFRTVKDIADYLEKKLK